MTTVWKDLLLKSIKSISDLPSHLMPSEAGKASEIFPMMVNPYYLGLISGKNCPIYRQCIPDKDELSADDGLMDPLAEEKHSPVPGLTHRYPDRVMMLVSNHCAVYCRFCNRRRKVGKSHIVTDDTISEGINYIRLHGGIRDVLLSGGDPLILETEKLREILGKIREIPHVDVIRIGTRIPCALPQRITDRLCSMLKQFHPLFINTHFNHPAELTENAKEACLKLADAGIPLGSQTVLLKHVNDNPDTIKNLLRGLIKIRVKPYYLFHTDYVQGTAHFRTSVTKGIDIIKSLYGHVSGLCIPRFAIDLPGGGGKIPITPEYLKGETETEYVFHNFKGRRYTYPKTGKETIKGLLVY